MAICKWSGERSQHSPPKTSMLQYSMQMLMQMSNIPHVRLEDINSIEVKLGFDDRVAVAPFGSSNAICALSSLPQKVTEKRKQPLYNTRVQQYRSYLKRQQSKSVQQKAVEVKGHSMFSLAHINTDLLLCVSQNRSQKWGQRINVHTMNLSVLLQCRLKLHNTQSRSPFFKCWTLQLITARVSVTLLAKVWHLWPCDLSSH